MAGLIPQTFIDELIARADIVELIGRRVRLKRQGREFAGLCPFHNEKSPSFTVSPQKQFFHCFGCGAHGTALGFIMRYDHLDFPQAVELLAGELGLEVPHEAGSGGENPHAGLYEVLSRAQRFYAAEFERSQTARDYLAGRGLEAAREEYGIGYAPASGETLFNALRKAGFSPEDGLKSGLLATNARGPYDRFRNRLMLPIHDNRGRTVGFGGRTLGDDKAKYLNSPETPVFHKGRLLYGLFEARQRERRLQRLVVVEGYLDVIGLAVAGYGAAVATLGTAVTEAQAEALFRTGAEEIIFCFDGDAAGLRAAWRALEQVLPALSPGRAARFAFLPSGEDPDSLVRTAGLDAFEQILEAAQPLSAYLFDTLAEPGMEGAEHRARFAGALKPLLQQVRDPLFRETLTVEAAERLHLPLSRLEPLLNENPPPRQSRAAPATRPSAPRSETAPPWDPRVERALALALAAPQAISAAMPKTDLSGLELPGANVLKTMVETLARHPHLTSASLLERFRTDPAAPRLGRLPEKYRDSIWQLAEDGQEARLALEFSETLERLEESAIEVELERLRLAVDSGQALDAESQARLRELLAKRQKGLNSMG